MDDRIYQDLVNAYYNLYEAKADEGLSPGEKMKTRLKRSGDPDEVTRQSKHLFGRYQKNGKINEEIVIDYLLDEGFTDSEEGAEIIMQNMSEKWYEFIIEGLPKTSTTNLEGHKEKIADLTTQINTLRQKQRSPKGLSPEEQVKLAKLSVEAKKWRDSSTQLHNTTGKGREVTKSGSRQSDPDDKMTPEERKAFRDTRSKVPTGTPEQRAATREGLKRKPATAGQTPQSTRMNLAPVTTRTRAQRTAAAASDAIVGGKDPSYYDKQGNKVALTSQGESERTYNVSGRRTTARYQQGATGSGTRGATPAGSTVDPERQKGPRGTGSRPNNK
jgi:hypothetical protein